MNELITDKIKALIKRAPKDWVQTLSLQMGKKPSTIYSYANGLRSTKSMSERIRLKTLLSEMVDTHEKTILDDLLN